MKKTLKELTKGQSFSWPFASIVWYLRQDQQKNTTTVAKQ